MKISLKETQVGLRNSTTRLPFRYGKACMTGCPQAVLKATIEVDGKVAHGYSADCLPPAWFDKSPEKSYAEQVDDMLAMFKLAEKTYREELSTPTELFPAWLIVNERIQSRAAEWRLPPLLASFGISIVERAVIDGMARASGLSFHQAVRKNIFAIEPGDVHQQLAGNNISDWIPDTPRESLWVRHTVGLIDPLTSSDVAGEERLNDGLPQTLEQYIMRDGIRYFKIKVSNNHDADLDRLSTIASLIEQHRGRDYKVTLDGNEQYTEAAEFEYLLDAMRDRAELNTFIDNILVIEQPLERRVALDDTQSEGIRRLSDFVPVIIDESDGTQDAYRRAIQLGYRGTSSKNCKCPIRSLLNLGLTWWHNERGLRNDYVMTGEDLCTVGIVSVQADLCLVATLGLEHIEKNGHHYHPGLSYLPIEQRMAALAAHGDFYVERGDLICPRIVKGQFHIGSLQCVGFGFSVEPDMDATESMDQWQFESLGL